MYNRGVIAFLLVHLALLVLGQGTQFITGACTSDAVCASGCCGFKSGKCAGPIIAQERDGGCGFGNAQPNANAAIALGFKPTSTAMAAATPAAASVASPSAAAAAAATGGSGAGNGAAKQFITGPCTSDADCASGCCGFHSGKCAGAIIAQERDGGCGFGNSQPNANAAIALGFHPTSSAAAVTPAAATTAVTPAAAPTSNAAAAVTPAAETTAVTPAAAAATGGNGAGNKAAKQFITGACTSDADCASGCCGFNSGKCAGAIVAQERDGGCGFGNATPNNTAAKALTGAKRGISHRRALAMAYST